MNAIQKVHRKYSHLDDVLSDRGFLPDGALGRIIYDLWQAVKAAVAEESATKIKRKAARPGENVV